MDELAEIGNEVLRTLATRLGGDRSRDAGDHQKHTGMHIRNTVLDIDELVFE